jgi:glycosyltransferase involved in cell wall biosynthesis
VRVLVHQQFHLGHHYQYVAHLLPSLIPLVDEVVVAITPDGASSTEYRAFLAPFEPRVGFDVILPDATPSLPRKQRWRLHNDLRCAVRRTRPDYVLVPSGDAQATFLPVFHLAGLGALPYHCPAEFGIHYGLGIGAVGMLAKIKDWLQRKNFVWSGANRVHVVSFLFYEQFRRCEPSFAERLSLMPHPVPPNPRLTKLESRRVLAIPEDGRYIGLAASIDSRKAIGEFLAAFRDAAASRLDRVLLAGFIVPSQMRIIESSFQDLIERGQLILKAGFLDSATFQHVLTALDVVCTPYPAFGGLSSTLLEGVAAGRPVLANAHGWSQAIIERFELGWTCDIHDHDRFVEAIRSALDNAASYSESEATKRLLAFHAPSNFGAVWVQRIRENKSPRGSSDNRSWSWVLEALSKDRRFAV